MNIESNSIWGLGIETDKQDENETVNIRNKKNSGGAHF